MDKSERYIKMCEKAEEIQKQRGVANWEDGDFYGSVFRDGVFMAYKGNDAWASIPAYQKHRIECIWLPHQDQLQEMIGDYNKCLDRLIGFSDMGIDRELEYYHQFTSFDQLWLAFVMADKEDKYWCWVEGDWVPHKVGVGEDLF